MFTGIIEELGVVEAVQDQGDAVRLTVRGPQVTRDARLGDSLAVNGCCLTVAERDEDTFTADVMRETLDKTALGRLVPGAPVNLERAVTPATRLGGHLVQGHVDGTGSVVRREPSEHWEVVEIALPPQLARYVVDKGSVTVDGVSLTVVSTSPPGPAGPPEATGASGAPGTGASFTVSLIPETLARTTLGSARPGDPVNLEVDIIAKYVERLLADTPTSSPYPAEAGGESA